MDTRPLSYSPITSMWTPQLCPSSFPLGRPRSERLQPIPSHAGEYLCLHCLLLFSALAANLFCLLLPWKSYLACFVYSSSPKAEDPAKMCAQHRVPTRAGRWPDYQTSPPRLSLLLRLIPRISGHEKSVSLSLSRLRTLPETYPQPSSAGAEKWRVPAAWMRRCAPPVVG
ncbi:hypothetical protein F4780DRAFT_257989 [Xylariomycetidae sp. FL0641]|nr:hypothetical protein F4780DRAFT_257989 [Xylariomycetidae sp. FL0641]